MATCPGQRTMEATRGNSYAPARGLPTMMMMKLFYRLSMWATKLKHVISEMGNESWLSLWTEDPGPEVTANQILCSAVWLRADVGGIVHSPVWAACNQVTEAIYRHQSSCITAAGAWSALTACPAPCQLLPSWLWPGLHPISSLTCIMIKGCFSLQCISPYEVRFCPFFNTVSPKSDAFLLLQ